MKIYFRNIKKFDLLFTKIRINNNILSIHRYTFVRSTAKQVIKKDILDLPNEINQINNLNNQDSKIIEEEKFDINSIDNMIISLYKKSKLYFFDTNKEPFENLGRHYKYYKFITDNLKHLKPSSSEKLIKAICYFNFKDNKTNEVLSIHLIHGTDKLNSASNVIFAINKLNLLNNSLLKNSIKVIENSEFSYEKLPIIIPLINSLTDLKINNDKINSNIDKFIIDNHINFKELELTILFKFYSQNHRYKYDILQLLLDRAIELINSFSIRSMMLLIKNLADLNLRNIHLLIRIKNRVDDIIKNKKKDMKNEEFSAGDLGLFLNNLVRLRFFEEKLNEFCKLEDEFFEILGEEDNNYETIIMMFVTHCKFFSELKINSIIVNKSEKLPYKIDKQFKEINDEFFKKIEKYLYKVILEVDFKTVIKIFLLIRDIDISKRKIKDKYFEIYINVLEKYLNEQSIDNYEVNLIEKYIDLGMNIFRSNEYKNDLNEKLKNMRILEKININNI